MINKEREGADESMRDTCEKWIRHHKEFVISCSVLIAYILIGSLIRGMVHHFGYEFRSWLSTTAFFIFLVLVLIVLVYGIGLIFHLSKKLCQHKLLKIFLNLLIAAIVVATICMVPWMTQVPHKQFQKEYELTRNGTELIAYVDQGNTVKVRYYEAVNFIVRKKQLFLEEDYGAIEWNPISGHEPTRPQERLQY